MSVKKLAYYTYLPQNKTKLDLISNSCKITKTLHKQQGIKFTNIFSVEFISLNNLPVPVLGHVWKIGILRLH